MTVNKKLKRDILKAVIIAIVILIFLQPSLFPQPIQQITYQMRKVFYIDQDSTTTQPEVVNQGVAMRAVIVDANGNVLQELMASPLGGSPNTFTIVSLTGPTGYNRYGTPPDCTGGCLAFETLLDNTGGDAEVSINSVTAYSECSWDNPLYSDPECTGLPNIMGPSGVGKGDLNSKWFDEITTNNGGEITLPKGEKHPESPIISDPLDLSLIDEGLINFSMLVVGTYLNEQGQELPLVGAGGSLIMEVVDEFCSDATTPVDFNSGDGDEDIYCTEFSLKVGGYCRISAYGEPVPTDRASVCGCCSEEMPRNPFDVSCGWEPVGDVCRPIGNCEDTWGDESCEPGGIRYCDAGSVAYACDTCYDVTPGDRCPKNANGADAEGCSGSFPNSYCDYPGGTGTSFYVKFDPPSLDPQVKCGDGYKDVSEGEDCDTNDFGGATCSSLGYGSGVLDCDVNCEYDTSNCQSPPTNINFRTTDLYYGSWTTDNTAVAYSDTCGNTLTGYGATSTEGWHQTSGTCATYTLLNDCTAILGTTSCLLLGDVVGNTPSGGDGIWSLYQQDTDSTRVWMCQNDLDASGFTYTVYDSDDPDASSVPTSEDPVGGYEGREEECTPLGDVKFRTGDPGYTDNSAIAHADVGCGNDLVKYGGGDTYYMDIDNCDIVLGSSQTQILTGLPGSMGVNGGGVIELWRHNVNTYLLTVCEDKITNGLYYTVYDSTSPTGTVSIDKSSTGSNEVDC